MSHRYGSFQNNGLEFVITSPKTPRAFDNFLWNDGGFSCVQQTGVGYFDYQPGDKEAVQLLTGIGRICDFDVHGRDGLMSRLIYIRDNESGEFWTVNWEPVCKPYAQFSCTHAPGYSILENTTNGINARLRIFMPTGSDPVELWTLELADTSGKARNLSVFPYVQFSFKYKSGFDSYGDMIYRCSYFSRELNSVIAVKHPFRKPHDFLTGFLTTDAPALGYDGSRDHFAGIYNTLTQPQAVVEGRCRNIDGSSDSTIGALQLGLTLPANGKHKFELLLGATDSEDGVKAMRERYLGKAGAEFTKLCASKQELLAANHLRSPDEYLNAMFNVWLKQETLYGAAWCRWGWMGYRDIVQHGYGVSSFKPERTREILLKALRHQYASGLALRGWNPVDTKAYSDSALWLVFTLDAYLKETGDLALLKEIVPFFDGGEAPVLAHIERALDFLENNKGTSGLCLIKFGDWNDSLTGVGKEGRGVSVWLSMAYAEAVRLMAELSAHLGDTAKKTDYDARYTRIKDALNSNAWDGEWFLRCYDDEGRPVGSHKNKQGRIYLNAQNWAMIAGIVSPERLPVLLESCERELQTPLGYRLLAPTYTESDPNLGRITTLEPGVCENGTVYSHINAFMMIGLLRYGLADKAYDTFRRIAPGYQRDADDPRHNCPPYIFANCYYGPDHRNNAFQMEFTWMTGSVAWYYNLILREMLGVRSSYAGLILDPRLPAEWNELSLMRQLRGMSFDIQMKRTGKPSLRLNGQEVAGNLLPWADCAASNKVEVTF